MKIILTFLYIIILFQFAFSQKCGIPINLTAKQLTASSVQLQWNKVPGAMFYRLQYRLSNEYWSNQAPLDTTTIVDRLKPNNEYIFRVWSVCDGIHNESDPSEEILLVLNSCERPKKLWGDSLGLRSARFRWNASKNAELYDFKYYAYDENNDSKWIHQTVQDTFILIKNLKPEIRYIANVRSYCKNGIYSDFFFANVSFFSFGCFGPQNIRIESISDSTISFHWDDVPISKEGFLVEYKRIQDTIWKSVSTQKAFYKLTRLEAGTIYNVRVRSKCTPDEISNPGDTITFTTSGCKVPWKIQTTIISPTSVKISWIPGKDLIGYVVSYKPTSSSTWKEENTTDSTKILNDLIPGVLYQVRVRSACKENNYSVFSDTLIFRMNPCGDLTQLFVDSLGYRYARLKWKSSENTKKYEFQYKKLNTSLWIQTQGQGTMFEDSSLEANISYVGRVRAWCEGEGVYSKFSKEIKFQAYGCNKPMYFKIDSITRTSAIVAWAPVPLAKKYKIEYHTVENHYPDTMVQKNRIKFTNLTTDTNYTVLVCPICRENEYSGCSDLIKFKTNPCPIPENLKATLISLSSVKISWDPTPESKGYKIDYKREEDSVWYHIDTGYPYWTFTDLDPNLTYDVIVRNVCEKKVFSNYSANLKVNLIKLGIPDSKIQSQILILPNPANDFISIRMKNASNGIAKMELYSITGVKMATHRLEMNGVTHISTADLTDGVYLCKFLIQDKWVGTQKLIISK